MERGKMAKMSEYKKAAEKVVDTWTLVGPPKDDYEYRAAKTVVRMILPKLAKALDKLCLESAKAMGEKEE